jgi:hypothetical protein
MPIAQIVTYLRPNIDTSFYPDVLKSIVADHVRDSYIATGKLISRTSVLSPDGLTKTVTLVFDNQISLDDYLLDEVIANSQWYRDRQIYCEKYNILVSVSQQPT